MIWHLSCNYLYYVFFLILKVFISETCFSVISQYIERNRDRNSLSKHFKPLLKKQHVIWCFIILQMVTFSVAKNSSYRSKAENNLRLRTQFTFYSAIYLSTASYEGARVHWIEISKAHFHFWLSLKWKCQQNIAFELLIDVHCSVFRFSVTKINCCVNADDFKYIGSPVEANIYCIS